MAKHPCDEQTDEYEEATVHAPDGQVPAPRRPALPRLRRVARPAAPTELPFAVPASDEHEPRVADLSALLADIDALRLTLQTDLSLAAAALEEGAQDLAAELVDGDLSEVRAFAGRAAERLAGMDEQHAEVPALVPVRRRRILSAAPLMAAAAALVGFVALSPGGGPAPAPETRLSSAAMAGYELSRLASEGAPDEQLRRAAEELNEELAALIAKAASDPVAAQQALMLLEQTTEVLASQGDSGVLRGVMAETRALRERLREALPVTVKKRPARPAVRPLLPVVPRAQEEPEKERSSSAAPKASPKPASTPKPSPGPTQTAAPEPPPADEPAPQTSEQPGDPLPDDEDIPGV